jgi:Flp pilus assembly protein TadB
MIWLAAAGACCGLGIVLVTAELWPAPPRLDAVLARIHAPGPAPRRGADPAAGRLGCWLAARLAGTRLAAIPRADLSLLGRAPETFLVHKLAVSATGLVAFAAAGAVLTVTGTGVPWQVPAGASLAAAACLWFAPDLDVRAEAARRRRDFTHAFISYLQLVRLARAAGAGTSEALEYAARTGDGWAFARIAATLAAAARARQPPWDHLAALGEDIGIPEVSELAGTAQTAGTEGARIAATLAARTESLRFRMLADARARASSRTTTMIVPLTLLGMGFVLLLAWPAFYTLIYAT